MSSNREKAIQLRSQGMSIIKIAKQLGVSKSSVSVWTRDVNISAAQKTNLLSRPKNNLRSESHSMTFQLRRERFQERGRFAIQKNEPLYIAGCMLYWGEGRKDINVCSISNSELPMLCIFKKFLLQYFRVDNGDITISVNAYTDHRSKKEIEEYWMNGLSLTNANLRKGTWNQYPSSSKKSAEKSEYGTCTFSVCKTEIVQEIFGAIQEFGQFKNHKWLQH